MAGDYKLMATKVAHAGVVVVETVEEFIDVLQFFRFCPSLPYGGTAMVTESGAFKALTLDFCESIGLGLPPLSPETDAALRQALPPFIPPSNPLDITAQALIDPDLVRRSLIPILADDKYGCVVLGLILTDETISSYKFPPVVAAYNAIKPTKPVIFAGLDEGAVVPRHYIEELRALGIPFYPSPERALRAVARITRYAAQQERDKMGPPAISVPLNLPLTKGVMAEYQSKEVLKAVGIPVPAGALARTLEEAQAIAGQIGYPVVLKAQAAKLAHKSDVGGVILNLADADALASGWKRLQENIARALPELQLDGVLVEKMGERGAELIVGAQNDKGWGPVLLVGFGGVLAEALKDVRLLSPELSVEAVMDELYQLKSSALLRGFRGSPALDVRAAAEIVCRLGALMRSVPTMREVDINPVIVYPQGQGAVALDALIVTEKS
jgi:acyl-CoA synthetase (NDP forming)